MNPEVLYIPGYYEEVAKIAKQAREMGITVPIVGGDGWDSPKLTEIAGGAALNNTFLHQPLFRGRYQPGFQSFR